MKICWIYQIIVASGLDGIRGLSAWSEGHARHCPPCRQQAENHRGIEQKLIMCAPQARREASPFLQSRIMAAWERESQEPTLSTPPRLPLWSMGLTGSCVALLALLIALHPSFEPRQDPVTMADSSEGILPVSAEPLIESVIQVNSKVIDGLSQALQNPLEREMESMLEGAKFAANIFAHNFLPGNDITVRLTREN